jgi:glycerol-3-phosphate acyltransferase PlsX
VIRIALDAMGGDFAPLENLLGASAAAAHGVDVILVGDEPRLKLHMADLSIDLPVVHAPEEITMAEDPSRAIREKPNSSISVCARMVREGEAAAMVSAGSTGAALAAAAIIIGRSPGVLRPTIATIFPTPGSPTVLLDSGANPEVKPEHLVQFAIMGSVLAEVYLGMDSPRVGLLNIGEEPGKGRPLEKEAYRLLEAAPIRFIGNVEGRDLAADRMDVLVTDGFTGNVVLKATEGTAAMVTALVMEAIERLDPGEQASMKAAMGNLAERLDYESTGGAHLLGVAGVVVIAHGSSSRLAVTNALRIARDGAERGLVSKVAERIGRS